MELCKAHFSDVVLELKRQALWHLVRDDAYIAQRAQMWLSGKCPVDQIDPLVIAMLEFRQKATLLWKIDPSVCALCAADRNRKNLSRLWVEQCGVQLQKMAAEHDLLLRSTG